MWGWLKPIASAASAVLGVGGELYSAQQNRAEAERNRQFQERMANTQVQRSVPDYTAAGLNPALAYDRSAAAPGGAQATIGNPITSGVSSAVAANQQRIAMETARVQNLKTAAEAKEAAARGEYAEELVRSEIQLREQTGYGAKMGGEHAWQNVLMGRQQHAFNEINQPVHLRQNQLRNQLLALDLPGAGNRARFEQLLRDGISNSSDLSEFAKLFLRKYVPK